MVLSPQCFHNLNLHSDIFNHSNVHFWEYMQPGYDALGFISCTGMLQQALHLVLMCQLLHRLFQPAALAGELSWPHSCPSYERSSADCSSILQHLWLIAGL